MARWILVIFFALVIPANAQSVEAFIGYSLAHQRGATDTPMGWNGSLAVELTPDVALVADVSRHSLSDSVAWFGGSLTASGNVTSFRFGPRVSWQMRKLSPFAQFLIGSARLGISAGSSFGSSSFSISDHISGPSMAFGGGLDIPFNDGLALRLGQIDYNVWRFAGVSSHGVRASFGLVFRFGESGR
jgi:hypothetical protein